MSDTEKSHTDAQALAKAAIEAGDHTGWFETLYAKANKNADAIPWADRVPNPNLVSWFKATPSAPRFGRALVVGCGLGDDAEWLSSKGFYVTAFDISPTAIDWAKQRFPNSAVTYQQGDVLALPEAWQDSFDLVFESYTLQVLPPDLRANALEGLAALPSTDGSLLVICRGRDEEVDSEELPPWPLTKQEISAVTDLGLTEASFEDYLDKADGDVRRFRAHFVRGSAPVEA